MQPLDPTTDLLSREQAAVEIGRSLGALERYRQAGRIQFLKINQRCVRVPRVALDKLKAELAKTAGPANSAQ